MSGCTVHAEHATADKTNNACTLGAPRKRAGTYVPTCRHASSALTQCICGSATARCVTCTSLVICRLDSDSEMHARLLGLWLAGSGLGACLAVLCAARSITIFEPIRVHLSSPWLGLAKMYLDTFALPSRLDNLAVKVQDQTRVHRVVHALDGVSSLNRLRPPATVGGRFALEFQGWAQ